MFFYFFIFYSITDKEVALGHHASNKLTGKNGDKAPLVSWEPYFCVLLQDEQTFTAYRSEEMAVSTHTHNFYTLYIVYIYILFVYAKLLVVAVGFYSNPVPCAAKNLWNFFLKTLNE